MRLKREIRSATTAAKLGTFKGDTCLKTILAKHDNCARYFGWDGVDQVSHFKTALDGSVGLLLWSLGKEDDVD